MGEKERKPFQLTFNGFLKVDFQGSRVTSDGGLILVRELHERLGLGELIDEHLTDSRQGTNKQLTFAALWRQSVDSRLAGYEDPQRRRAGCWNASTTPGLPSGEEFLVFRRAGRVPYMSRLSKPEIPG